eukprot:Blabericola_migrator_1__191@NODE_1050_length_5592_cov_103_667873_g722_i0_p3_GENE_NODE_1050_length_5592_cov_103_667873_g722_i0NODE_1050_length_5592_cov_103_667873_g722_i0_p3_ORF_typecomplete_len276_score40_10Paf1/PF03985_13/4_1e03Paf1/PF03985_13/0_2_NODE_1050_length_5592_cov_103_667873_g722_i036894516
MSGEGAPPVDPLKEEVPKQPRNGLTRLEKSIHNTLGCPVDLLRFPYEANALEHLPSRLLSLAPNPFGTLIGLCISSFADSLATPLSSGSVAANVTDKGCNPASSKTPLTDQILQSFRDAENLNVASVNQFMKGQKKKVKAIFELLPDQDLSGNVYSTANVPEGVQTESQSFMLTSEQSAQTCLYQSVSDNQLPEGVRLGPHDSYGVPVAMFNYQHASSQAPKRWLVMRHTPGNNVAYVSEMEGKRFALTLDREFSIEANSSIYLKVEGSKKRRIE